MTINQTLPSYEELFGNLDFKKGDEARSVYSPAAYLTDLLQLVEDSFQSGNGRVTTGRSDDISSKLDFDNRRGDIKDLSLNRENTFESIPYLDIVNWLLQRKIEEGNEGRSIYEILKTAQYPFSLPLHYEYERSNKFLKYLNLSGEELYKIFSLQADADVIARVSLGLSLEEYEYFLQEQEDDIVKIRASYGLKPDQPLNDLANVSRFLLNTGLSGIELRELLYQNLSETSLNAKKETERTKAREFFVNSELQGYAGLNETEERIVWNSGTNAANDFLPMAWFERCNRFIRLARKIKLSSTDLDLVLRTCCGNRLDASALKVIAVVKQVQQKHELPVDVICSLFTDINSLGIGDEDEPKDLFNRTFNGKYAQLERSIIRHAEFVPASYHNEDKTPYKELRNDSDILADSNKTYRKRLLRALKLSEKDFDFIITRFRNRAKDKKQSAAVFDRNIGIAELSLLFRISKLVELLDVSIAEFFDLLDLLEMDSTIRLVNHFQTALHFNASESDCYRILVKSGTNIIDSLWLIQTLLAVAKWMQSTDFTASELKQIQTGGTETKEASKVEKAQKIEVLNTLYQQFKENALSSQAFVNELFDARSSRVIYNALITYPKAVVSKQDHRLVIYEEVTAKQTAYQALRQIGNIYKDDFKGLKISEKMHEKIWANLIFRGYISAEGAINEEKMPLRSENFALATDFSKQRDSLYDVIHKLYLAEPSGVESSSVSDISTDTDFELSIYPSDLSSLQLAAEEVNELYDNLIFNGYLDEQGKVQSLASFARPENVEGFDPNVDLQTYSTPVWEVIKAQTTEFDTAPFYLRSEIFDDIGFSETETRDLIENLKFNGHINEASAITSKASVLSLTTENFKLALEFYPYRKNILNAIQSGLKKFKAEYYTFKRETLEGIAEEAVAVLCYDYLQDRYLAGNKLIPEKRDYFNTLENANTFQLGSYFTASDRKAVFNAIRGINQFSQKYQLADQAFEPLQFNFAERGLLLRQLIIAGHLDADRYLTESSVEYFLNINRAFEFHLEGFADFDKDIFFALHRIAKEHQSGINQIAKTLKELASSQEAAVFDVLAEGFETTSEIVRVICQHLLRHPINIVEGLILPVIAIVDKGDKVSQEPVSKGFNLIYRRIGQFIKLANKLRLGEKETEVIVQDQDLVEKFPEPLVLPNSLRTFDALLEGLDGKIYIFKGKHYWAYSADTYELQKAEAGLTTLSEAFAGLEHIDAAFIDNNGNAWIIAGAQYFVREKGSTIWRSRRKEWGKLKNNFFATKQIDASFIDKNGKIYLFSGDQYLRYSNGFQVIDEGYPRAIKGNWQEEFGANNLPARFNELIDASFEDSNEKVYLFKDHTFVSSDDFSKEMNISAFWGAIKNNFKDLRHLDAAYIQGNEVYFFAGDQVVRYTNCIENQGVCVDEGFPVRLTSLIPVLPDDFEQGIDAIFKGADNNIHIFKHNRYIKVSADFKSLLEEKEITERWGKVRNSLREKGIVDAAFAGLDGNVYLFSGEQYFRYSTKDYARVDEGYPRQIAGNWGGIVSVSEAFILDGKTYLFGLDSSGAKHFVRYSTADYSQPDEGYPQPHDQGNWFNLPESLIHGQFVDPDAVFVGLDGNTYLFSGAQFIYFDYLHRWWSEPQLMRTKWDSLPFEKVTAAFTGKDGKTYIFSGNQYVRYSDPGYNKIDDRYPQRIDEFWGGIVNNIERTRRIDAALVADSQEVVTGNQGVTTSVTTQHTYLFSGNQYYRYKNNDYDAVEEGYPRNIYGSLHTEPRLRNLHQAWKGSIDAAFADQGNVYLFQDDVLQIVTTSAYREYKAHLATSPSCVFVDEGTVYVEDQSGWGRLSGLEGKATQKVAEIPPSLRKTPEAFRTGVSSVLIGAAGSTFIFKGENCYNVSLEKSYPIKEEWGKVYNQIVENNHLDAAFVGLDGKLYVFSGNQFVSYSPVIQGTQTSIPAFIDGLPRLIEEHWGGLTQVALAFVRDGKTYLLERPNEEGVFRYVCYSTADYSKPDNGYIETADFSWWGIPSIYESEGFRRVDAVLVEEDNLFLIQGNEFISYNKEEGLWSYPRPLERIWRGLTYNETTFQKVTTAFKGPDEKVYFFSDEAFVSHSNDGLSKIEPINTRWGIVKNNFTLTGVIDAAFVWDYKETYLFSGDQYVKYSSPDYRYVDAGYPKVIADSLKEEAIFAHLPEEFSARMKGLAEKKEALADIIANRGNVYLFEGNNLHVVSPETLRRSGLHTIGKVKNRLRERNRVDAAYVNARNQVLLFSGDQYVRYSDNDFEFVDEGFPRRIGDEFAREEGFVSGSNVFPYDIDTAVKVTDGTVYLFKDAQYVGSDDPATKKEIKNLLGSPRNNFVPLAEGQNVAVDAAFVSPNGMTYVFKEDQFIRYAQFDNEFVDEGYPKKIKDNWGNLPVEFEASIDAGFVFEGKTYLLKENNGGEDGDAFREGKYVRYSRSDYKKIDSIYPQKIVNRWGNWGDFLLGDIQLISRYRHLENTYRGGTVSLTDFLYHKGTYQSEPYQVLAEIFGWNEKEVRWLKRQNAFLSGLNVYETHFNLELIEKMERTFALADKMGVGPSDVYPEVWKNLFTSPPNFKEAADALYRYLGANNSDKDWEMLARQIHNELNEWKRDVWVPLAISQDATLTRPRDLFESLLIDVEMGSCATTSKVKEAISALQLYLHRYFVNLELLELKEETGVDRQELKQRWEWMKNYRLWEANRKVFLYPENYLRPELRDTKTPAFKTLEDDLIQGEISDSAVEKAYRKYLDEYTEVSRLTIAGGYVYDDSGDKKLILFGRTKTEPQQYYYRYATFPKGQSQSARWEPWKKLNIQIDADQVYPVYAFGRVFVFWARVKTVSEATQTSTIRATDNKDGGQTVSANSKTDYLLRIHYSFLNLNEEWVPVQLLNAEIKKSHPFTDVKLLVENSEKIVGDAHEHILVSCSFSSADSVTGTVTAAAVPLAGATVTVAGTDINITTSDSGTFVIPSLAFGTRTITISKDGFERVERPLTLRRGGQVTVNVNLETTGIRQVLRSLAAIQNTPLPLQISIPEQLREKVSIAERPTNLESLSFTLTPELYTNVAQKPAFRNSGLDVFKSIFFEGIQEENIVSLNTAEDSTAWYSFDHKGGSFLCKPVIPALDKDVTPKVLKENTDGFPAWKNLDATFIAPDGKQYFFEGDQFTDASKLTESRKNKEVWGRKDNHIARTGIVDAAYQDGNKTFLFSGNQYLRFTDQLELADRDYPKTIGSDAQDPMPQWERIDAAFIGPDRLTYFFNNARKVFVTSENLNGETPYSEFWRVPNIYQDANSDNSEETSAQVTAAFVKDKDTYLIGSGKILKYSGPAYDFAVSGFPIENSLFNLLEVLGCDNNQESFKNQPVLRAKLDGADVLIGVAGGNFRLTPARKVAKSTQEIPDASFVLRERAFEFNGTTLSVGRSQVVLSRSVSAAFVGLDDNVYVFSGNEFMAFPTRGLAPNAVLERVRVNAGAQRISSKWGNAASPLLKSGSVDALLQDGEQTFLFTGNEYFRYTQKLLDSGYPKLLQNNTENLPQTKVDATFKDSKEKKTYFFSGTKFTASGAGEADTALRWGMVRNNLMETGVVNAAYAIGPVIFLLSGTEFYRYTTTNGSIGAFMDADYPKPVQALNGPVSIDAAFHSQRLNKTYLFAGSNYYKLLPGTEPDRLSVANPIKGSWGNFPVQLNDGLDAAIEIPAKEKSEPPTLYLFRDGTYFKFKDIAPFEAEEAKYDIIRLTTGTGYKLNQILFTGGIEKLLHLESQLIDEVPQFQLVAGNPGELRSDTILVNPNRVNSPPISSHLDFESANGIYYWEIFFHAPFLIAQSLHTNQRFALAKRWYEYIYDPTEKAEYWKFLPFLAVDMAALIGSIKGSLAELNSLKVDTKSVENIVKDTDEAKSIISLLERLLIPFQKAEDPLNTSTDGVVQDTLGKLRNLTATKEAIRNLTAKDENNPKVAPAKQQLVELLEIIEKLTDQTLSSAFTLPQLEAFQDDPFDPHAIAAIRKSAYRKAIVMNYVDNLLEWGDMLFRQYTAESIDEARMLYILAYDLLGKKPESLGTKVLGEERSYRELENRSSDYQFLFFLNHGNLENVPADDEAIAVASLSLPAVRTVHSSVVERPYYFIPENELFLEYWNRVEDRLYKIRHCLNILGISQPLPLFEPPINPMALVQAAATGALGQVTAGATVAVPHYRFEFLMFKVQNLLQKLNQFGNDLLITLEKKDAETLSQMQNKQEGEILSMMIKVKEAQLQETEQTILYFEESKKSAHERAAHFADLIKADRINEETQQFNLLVAAAALNYASSVVKIAAMFGSAAPDSMLGPFIIGIKIGGTNIGQMLTAGADVLASVGQALSLTGEALGVKAQFERMKQDWEFQRHVAESEEKQLSHQLEGAKYQRLGVLQDLEMSKKQIEQNESIQKFLKEKFTNQQLYLWMVGQLSGLYYQTYKLAFEMAKSAEKAFQFERGLQESEVNFISGQYWDTQRKGLLAGASLGLDVDRMEKAFIESNSRRLEITKQVSLLELDPLAFLQLKTNGVCEFLLSEAFFDYDFPGHYCRQVKTIAIMFDIGQGVYVNATLTQLTHKTVMQPDPKAVKFLLNPKDQPPSSIRSNWRTNQQIALSHHDEYEKNNGLFELRFDNDRYLPFEGTGAVSHWRLELNGKKGSLNLRNLVDVVINLKYTALQGGPVFAEAVKGMLKPYEALRFFDMTFDFADQWNEFLDGDSNELILPFTQSQFPNLSSNKIAGIFTKYDLSEPGQASLTLNGNAEWVLKDGKNLETTGLNISRQGSKLRFTFKGNKRNLRNIQFVFRYQATVS